MELNHSVYDAGQAAAADATSLPSDALTGLHQSYAGAQTQHFSGTQMPPGQPDYLAACDPHVGYRQPRQSSNPIKYFSNAPIGSIGDAPASHYVQTNLTPMKTSTCRNVECANINQAYQKQGAVIEELRNALYQFGIYCQTASHNVSNLTNMARSEGGLSRGPDPRVAPRHPQQGMAPPQQPMYGQQPTAFRGGEPPSSRGLAPSHGHQQTTHQQTTQHMGQGTPDRKRERSHSLGHQDPPLKRAHVGEGAWPAAVLEVDWTIFSPDRPHFEGVYLLQGEWVIGMPTLTYSAQAPQFHSTKWGTTFTKADGTVGHRRMVDALYNGLEERQRRYMELESSRGVKVSPPNPPINAILTHFRSELHEKPGELGDASLDATVSGSEVAEAADASGVAAVKDEE